jgi:hypothetical protein
MLVEIYFEIDEFVKRHNDFIYQLLRESGQYTRAYPCKLSLSEIMTILVYYHYSHYKCFKRYYTEHVAKVLGKDFPDLVSYNRFVELIPRALYPMCLFVAYKTKQSRKTGLYFIDSPPLEVSHPKRAHQHKVFKGWASWGKTSKGWFYGLKYHLVINQYGELMSFYVSSGNISDTNAKVLFLLTNKLKGYLFGDKGYLMNPEKKSFIEHEGRLSCITKSRSNSRNAPELSPEQQSWLKKRGVIDLQKEHMNIEHSRHRAPLNGFTHIYAALAAYTFYPDKPKAFVENEQQLIPEHLNQAA